MGFLTAKGGLVYRRWVNVIPSVLLSGGGHFLAGRKRAGIIWFLVTLCMCLIQFFLLFSPVNKSYSLYQSFVYLRITVLVIMAIESCRTPIPRLKLRTWAIYVCVVAAMIAVPFLAVRQFLFQPFSIPTAAMQPTLMGNHRTQDGVETSGDHIIVSKMAYWFNGPQRGDLVIFRGSGTQYRGTSPNEIYVKRIVGVPGETVSIRAPEVLINGKVLDHPPIFEKLTVDSQGYSGYVNLGLLASDTDKIVLGDDEYLVLGDNSQRSLDGRVFGPIKRSDIKGKVILITRPFERKGRPE